VEDEWGRGEDFFYLIRIEANFVGFFELASVGSELVSFKRDKKLLYLMNQVLKKAKTDGPGLNTVGPPINIDLKYQILHGQPEFN
jgi:hypothetical protein